MIESFTKILSSLILLLSVSVLNKAQATDTYVFAGDFQNEQTHSVDLNNDGLIDFLSFSYMNKSVLPFIQLPDGSFKKGMLTYLYEHPGLTIENIYPGQFDKDGKLDIVIVYTSQFVSFYKGIKDGRFVYHSEYEIPFGNSLRSTSGDLDSDGYLEIIVAPDRFMANRLSFFIFSNSHENFNDFPFSTKYQLLHFNNVLKKNMEKQDLDTLDQLAIGNFNNDHLKDIALLDKTHNRVLTLVTDSREKYVPDEILTLPYQIFKMSIIDINYDKIDDLVTTPKLASESNESHLYLRFQNKFTLFQKIKTGAKITDIKKGNFINGSENHFVFSSQLTDKIYLYSQSRSHRLSLKPVTTFSVPEVPGQINCADMNDDGFNDILVTGRNNEKSNIILFQNITLD